MTAESESHPADPRVRAAQTKRARTRQQILEAALTANSGDGTAGRPVVDDVLRTANVSRATFYKYFTSLDDVLQELGDKLGNELHMARTAIYAGITDPELRVATGFQLFLSRAAIDPEWGAFLVTDARLARDEELVANIRHDLGVAVRAGLFVIADMDAAIDVVLGTKAEAIRRLAADLPAARAYIETVTTMLLAAFGLPREKAQTVSATAMARLQQEGAARLSWWQRFD